MWLNFVKNLRFEWKRTLVKIWRELKLSLIGFFEGTRAIACTRREEKDERKRNNQRYFLFKSKKRNNKRHLFFKSNKEITKNFKNGQIYLDPSGGDDGEPEEGLDREDEESGFEVKKKCLLQK